MRVIKTWKLSSSRELRLLETTPAGRQDRRRLTWLVCSPIAVIHRRTTFPHKDIGDFHNGRGQLCAAVTAEAAAVRAGDQWFAEAVKKELAGGATIGQALNAWRLGDNRQVVLELPEGGAK